jgi:hypothetical protein
VGAQAAIGLHAHPMAAGAAAGDGDVGPRRIGADGRGVRAGAALARLPGIGERRGALEKDNVTGAVRQRSVVELGEWPAALHDGNRTNASGPFL